MTLTLIPTLILTLTLTLSHTRPPVQVGVGTPALAAYNNSGVETIVTGHGLTGDFGKDPAQSPLLIAAEMDDPDDGDSSFGNGDVITVAFDRPTNVSELALSNNPAAIGFDKRTRMEYVDSLFTLSEPLGDEYSGAWLDASTFEITVVNPANASVSALESFDFSVSCVPGGVTCSSCDSYCDTRDKLPELTDSTVL